MPPTCLCRTAHPCVRFRLCLKGNYQYNNYTNAQHNQHKAQIVMGSKISMNHQEGKNKTQNKPRTSHQQEYLGFIFTATIPLGYVVFCGLGVCNVQPGDQFCTLLCIACRQGRPHEVLADLFNGKARWCKICRIWWSTSNYYAFACVYCMFKQLFYLCGFHSFMPFAWYWNTSSASFCVLRLFVGSLPDLQRDYNGTFLRWSLFR